MNGAETNKGEPPADTTNSTGSDRAANTAIEIATGLTFEDVEALRSDGAQQVRAEIAAKFASQFDRLNRGRVSKITADILKSFSNDRAKLVRRRFAEGIKSSRHLPAKVAARLARDEIDIASPILETSLCLEDREIEDIIKTMPESYSLAITGRKPLSEAQTDLLIEHKGTLRVVSRLIDNDEAALSEASLRWLHQWGESNPEVAQRLIRRPNLPFEMIHDYVVDLAEKLQWASLSTQTMTSVEAKRLSTRIRGPARPRCTPNGARFNQLQQNLKARADSGDLHPADLLAALRDGDVDLVECGFTILAATDLKRVRNLLYGSDKRGLIALCLKASFSTADYLAFRVALGLVELGAAERQSVLSYGEMAMQFATEQFEQFRAQPDQIDLWVPNPPDPAGPA